MSGSSRPHHALPSFATSPALNRSHQRGADLTRASTDTGLMLMPGPPVIDSAAPLTGAADFRINGCDVLIPVASNAQSDLAAASHIARLARAGGGFSTSITGPLIRVPIIVTAIADARQARQVLLREREQLMQHADTCLSPAQQGQCRGIEVHLSDLTVGAPLLVMQVVVDACAGACTATIRAMARTLSQHVRQLLGGHAHALAPAGTRQHLAVAQVKLAADTLAVDHCGGPQLIERIVELHHATTITPKRANLHNASILRAVTPVLIATGHDPRATEAAAHGWAARSGTCTALTTWQRDHHGDLLGTLQVPVSLSSGHPPWDQQRSSSASSRIRPDASPDLGQLLAAIALAQSLAVMRLRALEEMTPAVVADDSVANPQEG